MQKKTMKISNNVGHFIRKRQGALIPAQAKKLETNHVIR